MTKISVLIITRNRSFVLPQCLDSLKPEITPEHEVVVIDSSTDGRTQSLIRHYPWLRYKRIFLPPGTRPESYSAGAQMCRGEIIALLDDDAIVHPGWLEALSACYENPETGAAGGRILAPEQNLLTPEVPLPVGLVNSKGGFASNFYQETGTRLFVDSLRGCNMSVRRRLLEEMNYFDARFRGQNCRVEDDICFWVRRMGYKIVFEPEAVVTHLAEERPDIPRSEFNMRSEFYVWRNTVWLFVKHCGWKWKTILQPAFVLPAVMGLRRVLGGSFKRPFPNRQSLRYFPAAMAGIAGGLWGLWRSAFYTREETRHPDMSDFIGDKAWKPGEQLKNYACPEPAVEEIQEKDLRAAS
jgi:cellulose synthase/poly-beta-1,6-N-acetylglucosamine synthase-like glycosyltransferase